MLRHYFSAILIVCLLVLTLVTGCDRGSKPPEPISLEELPPALDKAFTKAKPETKDLAAQVNVALRTQDYSKAYVILQTLCGVSGLTKDQTSILSRGMLTVNNTLQAAQAKGDQKAADTLRWQRATK